MPTRYDDWNWNNRHRLFCILKCCRIFRAQCTYRYKLRNVHRGDPLYIDILWFIRKPAPCIIKQPFPTPSAVVENHYKVLIWFKL